jgi:hypothetical protein
MFEPELEMLAEPAATVPPVGSVLGATSAYAELRLHGSKAALTAKATARGCMCKRCWLRALRCISRCMLRPARFVVAMVLSL